jgi:hypothetical protein
MGNVVYWRSVERARGADMPTNHVVSEVALGMQSVGEKRVTTVFWQTKLSGCGLETGKPRKIFGTSAFLENRLRRRRYFSNFCSNAAY